MRHLVDGLTEDQDEELDRSRQARDLLPCDELVTELRWKGDRSVAYKTRMGATRARRKRSPPIQLREAICRRKQPCHPARSVPASTYLGDVGRALATQRFAIQPMVEAVMSAYRTATR